MPKVEILNALRNNTGCLAKICPWSLQMARMKSDLLGVNRFCWGGGGSDRVQWQHQGSSRAHEARWGFPWHHYNRGSPQTASSLLINVCWSRRAPFIVRSKAKPEASKDFSKTPQHQISLKLFRLSAAATCGHKGRYAAKLTGAFL
jgi:hypothetical protein